MTGSHYRDEPTTVRRYSAAARVNHWITAGSLILLALSGMALFHPSLFFLTGLFGGGEYTRIVHPWIGLVLLVSFAGLFLRFWRLNLWERTDNVWLGRVRAVLAGREEELPEVGKYNAGQKLVFWGMSILIVLLFISGVGIWGAQHGSCARPSASSSPSTSSVFPCWSTPSRRSGRSSSGSSMSTRRCGSRAPSAR